MVLTGRNHCTGSTTCLNWCEAWRGAATGLKERSCTAKHSSLPSLTWEESRGLKAMAHSGSLPEAYLIFPCMQLSIKTALCTRMMLLLHAF